MLRTATMPGQRSDLPRVESYLPTNYAATWSPENGGTITIMGCDSAGCTMDGYVIPRLASGMMFARET